MQLVSLMSGRLDHDDNPGGGSIFWFELPLVGAAGASLQSAPIVISDLPDAREAPLPERALLVLVVDDIAMNREIAAAFIRSAGHDVVCVVGGAEAVEAAATTDFDVIIMDVRMPGVDGLEATRRIRRLDGVRGRVPVLALTAQVFTEQVEECRMAGMDDHLAKPFTLEDLLKAVGRVAAAGHRPGSAHPQPDPEMQTGKASVVVAPTAPAFGSEMPLFDLAVFERTAGFLEPEVVALHLRTLAEKASELLDRLRVPDALASHGLELAEAAHALAGGAGMLGFERLTFVARHFERAVEDNANEALMRGNDLGATIADTLQTIHERTPVVVAARVELLVSRAGG